jgi:hypothetical protein
MSKRVVLSICAAAAWLPAVAPAASASCPKPSSASLLAHSRTAIVYEGDEGAIFGCLLHTGRPYRLNHPSEFGGFTPIDTIRFAGHFVAFQEDFESAAGSSAYWVMVRNLRNGKAVSESQISQRGGDYGDESEILLLKRNGSVAWLAETESGEDEDIFYREVHIADRDHRGRVRERMVDQYHRIGRNSLKLSADRRHVTWLHGKTVQRATFR